jgi:hypothetical protein
MVRAKQLIAKIEFHDNWNLVGAQPRYMLLLYKGLVRSVLDYASACYSGYSDDLNGVVVNNADC